MGAASCARAEAPGYALRGGPRSPLRRHLLQRSIQLAVPVDHSRPGCRFRTLPPALSPGSHPLSKRPSGPRGLGGWNPGRWRAGATVLLRRIALCGRAVRLQPAVLLFPPWAGTLAVRSTPAPLRPPPAGRIWARAGGEDPPSGCPVSSRGFSPGVGHFSTETKRRRQLLFGAFFPGADRLLGGCLDPAFALPLGPCASARPGLLSHAVLLAGEGQQPTQCEEGWA